MYDSIEVKVQVIEFSVVGIRLSCIDWDDDAAHFSWRLFDDS
jgi:hypothetical protein